MGLPPETQVACRCPGMHLLSVNGLAFAGCCCPVVCCLCNSLAVLWERPVQNAQQGRAAPAVLHGARITAHIKMVFYASNACWYCADGYLFNSVFQSVESARRLGI